MSASALVNASQFADSGSAVDGLRPMGSGNDQPFNTLNGTFSLTSAFTPRRPVSASSLMKRQARSFNFSLLLDDDDTATNGNGSFPSRRSLSSRISPPSTSLSHSAVPSWSFYDSIVKPFLLLKGTTDGQRRDLMVSWAADIAHSCRVAVLGFDGADVMDRLVAERAQSLFEAFQKTTQQRFTNAMDAPPNSPSSNAAASKTATTAAAAAPVVRRWVSSSEKRTFLHVISRDANISTLFFGTATSTTAAANPRPADPADGTDGSPTSTDVSVPFTPLQALQLLLRVSLHCCSSVSNTMSDFDFRRRGADRKFTLHQASDLDSTDEDHDDGAPRPLDAVILTVAEVLLVHFKRLGFHDRTGAVKDLSQVADADSAVLVAVEDVRLLTLRLSMDSQAERTFGVMLGLAMLLLEVVDDHGAISRPFSLPMLKYIDEQRSFYTMKADGASMNRELVEMYDRLGEPFYGIVRRLRVWEECQEVTKKSTSADDGGDSPVRTSSTSKRTSRTHLGTIHEVLERFISFYKAERHYDKDTVRVFYAEMTSRERLYECERDHYGAFLSYVLRKCPVHGAVGYLSGAVLYRVKEDEREAREAILEAEAAKYAFHCRVHDARGVLPLTDDPKKVANRLVPTTRPPSVGHGPRHIPIPAPPSASNNATTAAGAADTPSLRSARPRPGSAKESYFSTPASLSSVPPALQKRSREVMHAETSERLRLAQEELDRWFVMILKYHVQLAEMIDNGTQILLSAQQQQGGSPHHRPHHAQHHPAALALISGPGVMAAELSSFSIPRNLAEATRGLKSVLQAAEDEANASTLRGELVVRLRALEAQEAQHRSDFVVEAHTYQDTVFQQWYYDMILVPRETERCHREQQWRISERIDALISIESEMRAGIVEQESRDLGNLFVSQWATHQEIIWASRRHVVATEESNARTNVAFTESAARDMLITMQKLQWKLNKDLFRRVLTDDEVEQRREVQAREKKLEQEWRRRQQAKQEAVEDLCAVETSMRRSVEASFAASIRSLYVAFITAGVAAIESTVRAVIQRAALSSLTKLAQQFLVDAVAMSVAESNAIDAAIAHLDEDEASSAASAEQQVVSPLSAPSTDPSTVEDGTAQLDEQQRQQAQLARAAREMEALERVTRRAHLLQLQQAKYALRGFFRCWLFDLNAVAGCAQQGGSGAVPPTPTALAVAVAEQHRERVSREVVEGPSPDASPAVVQGILRSMDTTSSPATSVTTPSALSAGEITPPPAATPFRTRAYLRPLSAATAAAASHRHRNSAAGAGGSTPNRTPTKPTSHTAASSLSPAISLVDRVTQFNRVWVSESTRLCHERAALAAGIVSTQQIE